MNTQQKHQEERRLERDEKRANLRQAGRHFSLMTPTLYPMWFWVLGISLTLGAILIWTRSLMGP